MDEDVDQKALFTKQTVVNYFTSRVSSIYTAALVASKAFDRVHQYGLFRKLLGLGIPFYLINIVINLHLNLKGPVKWNGTLSNIFHSKSGGK